MNNQAKTVVTLSVAIDNKSKEAVVVINYNDGSMTTYELSQLQWHTNLTEVVNSTKGQITLTLSGSCQDKHAYCWHSPSIKQQIKNTITSVKDYIADHGWRLFD